MSLKRAIEIAEEISRLFIPEDDYEGAVPEVTAIIARAREEDAKTIKELREALAKIETICIKRGYWKSAPCCICGYNGPGYFQEETHKCASKIKE